MLQRTLKRFAVGTAVAAISLGAGLSVAAAEPVKLSVASFSQKSSWYAFAVGMAEMLRAKLPEGSVIDTPPEGGGTSNPLLIASGKKDLAFGFASVSGWARDGVNVYKKPIPNLRGLLGGFGQYYLAVVVRGAGQPSSFEGYLKANPKLSVVLRQRGSAGAAGGIQMLTAGGSDPNKLDAKGGRFERARSFGAVKDALVAGQADLWIHTVTRGHPSLTEIAQTTDLTFLQPSDATIDAMKKFAWYPATLPSGSFRGQDKDLSLPGTSTNLFVRDDFPDELAYLIVKTICEDVEKFKTVHKALASFSCATAWKPEIVVLDLHPGAARYFKEAGLLM